MMGKHKTWLRRQVEPDFVPEPEPDYLKEAIEEEACKIYDSLFDEEDDEERVFDGE